MNVIMDTGPWVAMVDRSESMHMECVQWLEQFEGDIFSTEAVLTEVLYLLNFSLAAQFAAMDFRINRRSSNSPCQYHKPCNRKEPHGKICGPSHGFCRCHNRCSCS